MSLETETTTGTNVKQSVPFFMVANMEESVRYCIDIASTGSASR